MRKAKPASSTQGRPDGRMRALRGVCVMRALRGVGARTVVRPCTACCFRVTRACAGHTVVPLHVHLMHRNIQRPGFLKPPVQRAALLITVIFMQRSDPQRDVDGFWPRFAQKRAYVVASIHALEILDALGLSMPSGQVYVLFR